MSSLRTQPESPFACRPEAFDYVRRHLPCLDSTKGLVHAVLGVSLHALDDVSPAWVDHEIERIAGLVKQQCRSTTPSALVAHLHDVLFVQEGFSGSPPERYYSPLNSYLPAVLHLKWGIPISLALVYKAVAELLGLKVEGIAAPGHFLIRVHDGSGWMIVDPFQGGRVLTLQEACALVSTVVGEAIEPDERYLPSATHKQWLVRAIANLSHSFEALRKHHDLQAMQELQSLVQQYA